MVSIRQMLAWMQNPVPADQLTPEILGCGLAGGAPGAANTTADAAISEPSNNPLQQALDGSSQAVDNVSSIDTGNSDSSGDSNSNSDSSGDSSSDGSSSGNGSSKGSKGSKTDGVSTYSFPDDGAIPEQQPTTAAEALAQAGFKLNRKMR
jgi:hypothetical protein